MKQGFKFFYPFLAVMLTAYICSIFTDVGMDKWYNNIDKPAFIPANALFPVVWTVLYIMIAVSTYMVLRDADSYNRKKVNNIFIAQLFLQILWCFVFFAHGHLGLGLAIILLLDVCVFMMIAAYAKVSKTASYIIYPYYWWLIFATFMNSVFVYKYGLIMVF